jgi:hypothetical protein
MATLDAWVASLSRAEGLLEQLSQQLAGPVEQALSPETYQWMLQLTALLQGPLANPPLLLAEQAGQSQALAERCQQLAQQHQCLEVTLRQWQQWVWQQQQHVAIQRQQHDVYRCH